MAENENLVGSAVEKLKFIESPLQEDDTLEADPMHNATTVNVTETKAAASLQEPRIAHNDDATNLEVFYDLFLACLNLFSSNQQLSTLRGLSAYTGFFGLIWSTWFMTSMFDVRFLKDSVFERCARGVHLGVLVGFVVVSPNFNTEDQDPDVFKVFSIILMTSRLCLCFEYGGILFFVRRHKSAILPLAIQFALHFVAAIVYLGISFRFVEGHNSRVFSLWYVLAGGEIIVTMALSHYYKLLSFHGTYMMKRVGLLTCIFFGEGVAQACSGITKVVKAEDHLDVWTSQTIGTVTACIALTYIVFMVYSDWVSKVQLPGWRQLTWILLHFPLHLSMSLFMEGCTQFIVFWKMSEKANQLLGELKAFAPTADPETFAADLRALLEDIFLRFPPMYSTTYTLIDDALATLDAIDFPEMFRRLAVIPETKWGKDEDYASYFESMRSILTSLENSIYNKYGIDYIEDVLESAPDSDLDSTDGIDAVESMVNVRNLGRFMVVFQYTFVCAGIFLMIANLISIVSRTKRWTISATIYHTVIFLLAGGIGSVAAVSQNESHLMDFQSTPWILPTLLLTYVLILCLNHVSGWLAWKRDQKKSGAIAYQPQYEADESGGYGYNQQQYTAVAVTDHAPEFPAPTRKFTIPRVPVPSSRASYPSADVSYKQYSVV